MLNIGDSGSRTLLQGNYTVAWAGRGTIGSYLWFGHHTSKGRGNIIDQVMLEVKYAVCLENMFHLSKESMGYE